MKKYLKIFLIFTVVFTCIFSTVSCTEAPEDNGTSESTVSDTPTETDGSSDTTSEATETDEISNTTSEAEETDEREYAIEIPERYKNSNVEGLFSSFYVVEGNRIKTDFTLNDIIDFFDVNSTPEGTFHQLFGGPHAYYGYGYIRDVYITSDGYLVYFFSPKREFVYILDESGKPLGIDEWLEKH